MKKLLISAIGLSIITSHAFAGSRTSDIRDLHINESPVQFLPKVPNTNKHLNASHNISNSLDNPIIADVVIFYQPSYFAKYGAYEAHKRIDAWVATANASYAAHGFNYQLSVSDVIAVQSIDDDVPYQDVVDQDGNIVQDGADYLFSLAALNEGSPEYTSYQEKWGGDLVVYVREQRPEDTVLGLAGIGGEYSSVVDNDIAPEQYTTFAHEIGHNIGMNHEEAKAYVGPEYARATMCGGNYTIMYSASPDAKTLHHYSSPELSSGGEACGNEATANNARVLRENFLATAQRREGVASLGSVSFSTTSFSGSEAGGVELTLIRTGDVSEAASVKVFAESGTALYGSDFTDAYQVAEFVAGESETSITYPVVSDSESENLERFSVSLRYPYKLTISNGNADVFLSDNNISGSAGVFSINGPIEVSEGESATYSITRVGGLAEAVVNVITTGSTAVEGTDFVLLNESLVFGQNETEKFVTFDTIDNGVAEQSKSVSISISSPSDSAEYDNQRVDVTILDNDGALDVGVFSLNKSLSVSEASGNVSFKVQRFNGDGIARLRVYSEDSTAISGIHFSPIDQYIDFAAGEMEKELSIDITNDSLVQSDRDFFIKIEGEGLAIDNDTLIITINEDDLSITPTKPDAGEGSSGGSFGVLSILLLSVIRIFKK